MTEAEWLGCAEPRKMFASLRRVSDRKFFLLAAACCRRLWGLFPHRALHDVVTAVEAFADGFCDWEGALATREAAYECAKAERRESRLDWANRWGSAAAKTYHATLALLKGTPRAAARTALGELASAAGFAASHGVSGDAGYHERARAGQAAFDAERKAQSDLIRDVFGPRRREPLLSAWRAPTVQTVAGAAYDERRLPAGELDPVRLAVLADALEEARCGEADLLSHLRSPGPHVRGCWAVDLALGRQ